MDIYKHRLVITVRDLEMHGIEWQKDGIFKCLYHIDRKTSLRLGDVVRIYYRGSPLRPLLTLLIGINKNLA